MQRVTLFFLFITLAVSVLYLACNDKSVDSPIKNLRELSWSIDTLAYPGSFQTDMYNMWGSSANDLYVVGHNSLNRGKMWHFDGKSWTDVKLSTTQGGNISGPIDLWDIYGFGPDDVWAVGEHIRTNPNPPPNFLTSSLLIHFDGRRWQEIETPEGRSLVSIWGSSPDDIWMAGINGTLFHYDGTSVKADSVPLSIPKDADPVFNFFSITGNSSGEVYMILADFGSGQHYLLARQGDTWVVLDSTFDTSANDLWTSPSETIYYTGDHVYKREGTSWMKFFEGSPGLRYFDIYGTDDDNLFVVGWTSTVEVTRGEAFHYNGIDWFHLENLQIPNIYYGDVWTDGREVFILGDITGKSIVLHGK